MRYAPRVSTIATVYGDPGGGGAHRFELVVVEGHDEGRALVLREGRAHRVGTAADCDLVLTDERISGHHLEIVVGESRFEVVDEGSTNGTFYQGSRIGRATLPPGATLKLGRSVLRLQPRAEALQLPPSRARRFGDLVGVSLAMRQVFAVLEHAAASDVTVLIEGETGTGKELAARALHEASERRRGPFVAVDCGALPESLVDSELFGHVRGAFTGATTDRTGAFARARGGTLFLDEIDGVSAGVQARLLRALEERCIRPVGADRELPLDLRLVVATQAPLTARVAEGRFRADLFYRVAVLHLRLPPLRERREDIAPIVAELLHRRGLAAGEVSGPGLPRLLAHEWPGNVRELRNVIEYAFALGEGPVLSAGEVPPELRGELPPNAKKTMRDPDEAERQRIREALRLAGGQKSQAAELMGISRTTLWRRMRELKMND